MQGFCTIGRARGEAVSATAHYIHFPVIWMGIWFHKLDFSLMWRGAYSTPTCNSSATWVLYHFHLMQEMFVLEEQLPDVGMQLLHVIEAQADG